MAVNRNQLVAIPDEASKAGKDIRDNFARLEGALNGIVMAGFRGRFMDIQILSASVAIPINHQLGFVPGDIIETARYTPGNDTVSTVNWLWNRFDITNIYVTTSGPVVLRFFLGRVS